VADQIYTLDRLKPLTSDQYDQCRQKALDRVQNRIGNRPRRSDFVRELGSIVTILDWLALLVFGSALVVSSIHIINHMGQLAANSYGTFNQTGAGTVIGRDFYTAAHQWAVIPLAEGSMILFLVMFGMSGRTWRKGVYLLLAVTAVIFVIVANWQSNIGILESLLAPIFTVGIGLKLENLIVQSLRRRDEVSDRYLKAMAIYEAASKDATKHPEYIPLFKQEIWQKLTSLPTNREFRDAPAGFRHAAVAREMERDSWAYALAAAPAAANPLPTANALPAASAPALPYAQPAQPAYYQPAAQQPAVQSQPPAAPAYQQPVAHPAAQPQVTTITPPPAIPVYEPPTQPTLVAAAPAEVAPESPLSGNNRSSRSRSSNGKH
jgi:hypothetical protein